MLYYSQSNQDKFLDKNIFTNLKNGFFIEIGAYDGISLSNTFYFEKNKGWKGICVEPIPSVFGRLIKNRTCECIHGCISKTDGEIEITHVDGPSEMLTGITDNYNQMHRERIEKELNELGGKKTIHLVKTYNLTKIMDDRNIKHINYCSIDVEGSEWDVLQSIDFSRITFDALTIENNYDDNKISDFLGKYGYVCIGRLDADEVFVDKTRNDLLKLKIAINWYYVLNKINSLKNKLKKK